MNKDVRMNERRVLLAKVLYTLLYHPILPNMQCPTVEAAVLPPLFLQRAN